jgi:hypothetical protein
LYNYSKDKEIANELEADDCITESKELAQDPSTVVVISKNNNSLKAAAQKQLQDFNEKEAIKQNERRRKIRIGTMMCVSYSALIGGTGSLTGSTTQLAFKGILQQ